MIQTKVLTTSQLLFFCFMFYVTQIKKLKSCILSIINFPLKGKKIDVDYIPQKTCRLKALPSQNAFYIAVSFYSSFEVPDQYPFDAIKP